MLLFLMTLLVGCGEKETDSTSDTASEQRD
jgi:hypothetical protein